MTLPDMQRIIAATPATLRPADLKAHIEWLASSNGIMVRYVAVSPQIHAALLADVVYIPVPVNDGTYAIGLHELGHMLHVTNKRGIGLPDNPIALMQDELNAWSWAKDHALYWSPSMTLVERIGLESRQRPIGV